MTIDALKVETLLAERGMTKTELSAACGVCRQNLSTILRRKTCEPRTAGKLAAGLGVPVEEIVEKESRTMKFYFTYGTDGQPFVGGWTEVEAPNYRAACAAFRAYHPDKIPNCLNCSSIYTEEQFKKTGMAGPDGNFGRFCHERITLRREAVTN